MYKVFKRCFYQFLTLSFSFLVLVILNSEALAQDELLFGQNHSYSVVFRGNGEAVVYSRVVFTNNTDALLTNFSFELPKVYPEEIVIYQIKLPKECVLYDYKATPPYCVEWRDPDYTKSNYRGSWEGNVEYLKAYHVKVGGLYKVNLPVPVEVKKSSALVMAYSTKSYTKKSLGVFKFKFETIRVPSRIEKIRVAVNVDSDLIIKGARGSVDYYSSGPDLKVYDAASFGGITSNELNSIVSRIGYYGTLTKSASNLAPNEAFVVQGEYAKSWFILYWKNFLAAFLVVLAVLIVLYLGFRFSDKIISKKRGDKQSDKADLNQPQKPQNFSLPSGILKTWGFVYLLVGLVSTLLVVGITYIFVFILNLPVIKGLTERSFWFFLLCFFLSLLCYILIIFGLAVVLAIKRGWKAIVFVLMADVFWFVVFLIVYLALFSGPTLKSSKVYDSYPPVVDNYGY